MLVAEAVQRAEASRIAFADGISQGIQQDLYRNKLETAKNLLVMNLSIENIAQATGLSIKKVKAL